MHVTGRNLALVLANTIAVMVALYLAFASDLKRPYWAVFTVFSVAQPITGAVRSKVAFPLFGTVAGAAMAGKTRAPRATLSSHRRAHSRPGRRATSKSVSRASPHRHVARPI
jgi:hypothetical protein